MKVNLLITENLNSKIKKTNVYTSFSLYSNIDDFNVNYTKVVYLNMILTGFFGNV